MSQKTRTQQQRTYAGEEDGRPLAVWLNENQETPAGARIKVLLTVAHLLSKTAPALLAADPGTRNLGELVSSLHRAWKSRSEGEVRSHAKPNRPSKLSSAELARLLLKRVGLPEIHAHVAAQYVGSGPARRASFVLKPDDVESAAVLRVLGLSQKEILDRVRRCRCCGTWFFARFQHQNFCQTKCQQKHYRTSDEWKAHRREWARDYYRKKQMPNIKGEGI